MHLLFLLILVSPQSKKGNIWFSEVSSLEGSIPEQKEHLQLCAGHSVRYLKLQAGNENADLELAFAVPKKLPIQTLSDFVL